MTLSATARLREEATDAAYALGWRVVRKMPERSARLLFAALADQTWQRHGKGVRQLEKNLCRVLGKDAVDDEVRILSKRALRSYMRYWLEVFRLPEISRERILGDMRVSGHEKLFATLDSGRGAVLALPHMGNYEQAGAWVGLQGYPITTVAERLRPQSLFDRFVAFRQSLGFEVLPLGGGNGATVFGTLARRLRAGRLVCLVADRDLTSGGVEVDFFGKPARMPGGPAALALQTGTPLYPVTLWYDGPRWAAKVHEEIPVPDAGSRKDKVRAMTQSLALVFQEGIAQHPEDWHMLQKIWVEDLA
ncbi:MULTISPECIES: phosphatidylinositol mannoside acyltransferase [Thermomonospora]|uniref:Lipid A biosynthesis acyltransferase n=1 Tax=Thermomonospora curvata (strain ATCC 19995 / DSM 43183 / JCM 3096 / KCTC 9072 / NBRC 15933 / NCIMB 10081 / Henssen B9) TaxID=471852 RepID=D1AEU2_THECD|nr:MULTISPECIES: phosphatidylinositol mannoside acyltransferase [Thermomonospora]ACY97667.1 lipid A biosynthesis acyltransferase [Thermomonospora curvata DSM 43183]PKK14411.1 MAG: phosphatidylinositol mannoside acyltransferase [Thermomonospora sp. CIF 1]